MTDDQKKNDLVLYRLKQAYETFDEAAFLFDGKKNPRSVINRLYYSMFYAVLALLVTEPYSSSKHSGIISYFNKNFIKNGIFSREMGKIFNETFELRQSGDYEEYAEITMEQTAPYLEKTKLFIDLIKSRLEKE